MSTVSTTLTGLLPCFYQSTTGTTVSTSVGDQTQGLLMYCHHSPLSPLQLQCSRPALQLESPDVSLDPAKVQWGNGHNPSAEVGCYLAHKEHCGIVHREGEMRAGLVVAGKAHKGGGT